MVAFSFQESATENYVFFMFFLWVKMWSEALGSDSSSYDSTSPPPTACHISHNVHALFATNTSNHLNTNLTAFNVKICGMNITDNGDTFFWVYCISKCSSLNDAQLSMGPFFYIQTPERVLR